MARIDEVGPVGGAVVLGSVRRNGWVQVTRGVHRPVGAEDEPWTLSDELRAWQLVLPRQLAFTHLTGAELLGWWLPPRIRAQPLFASLPITVSRPRRPGLLVARHPGDAVGQEVDGVRLVDCAEIILEAARDLSVLDVVVLIDSAIRRNDLDIGVLRALSRTGRRGAPTLRKALALVDPRSESPWESVARVLHVAADIPVEPQFVVRDDEGTFVARGDLRISGTRRLHEYDGEVHRSITQQVQDLDRDRRLQLISWQRFGYTSRRLLHQGAVIIRDADQVLGRDWDPRRLQRWNSMVRSSAYSAAGRRRLERRWARAWGASGVPTR